MLNRPFSAVATTPIFKALKDEAEFKGSLSKSDPRYVMLQKICNYFRESGWLRNLNGAPTARGNPSLMFPLAETWEQVREELAVRTP